MKTVGYYKIRSSAIGLAVEFAFDTHALAQPVVFGSAITLSALVICRASIIVNSVAGCKALHIRVPRPLFGKPTHYAILRYRASKCKENDRRIIS